MARRRIRAAQRKAEEMVTRLARERTQREHEPAVIADGVRAVAEEIAPMVKPGSLYWTAPFQYVIEQMAPRVCVAHGLDPERVDDVAGYLLAALNEFAVALVGEFDLEHFEAWTAAAGSPSEGVASG